MKVKKLQEGYGSVTQDLGSIELFLQKEGFYSYDVVDYDVYPMDTAVISFEVEGDWKHEHLLFEDLIEEWANENNRDIFKIESKTVGSSDSDYYTAIYKVYITKDHESFDRLNSMRGLFEALDNGNDPHETVDLGYLHGIHWSATLYDSGNVYIHQHHPYDDAEYCWAYSTDDGYTFHIVRDRKELERFKADPDEEYQDVIARMVALDKNTKSRMLYDSLKESADGGLPLDNPKYKGKSYLDILYDARDMENDAIEVALALDQDAPEEDREKFIEIANDENDHDRIYADIIRREEGHTGSITEELINPPEEDIEEFESILSRHGFEIEDKGKTLFGNIHYQIRKSVDREITSHEEFRNIIDPFIEEVHHFEEEKDIPITWNFGYDGSLITAGMDLSKKWLNESLTNKELKEDSNSRFITKADVDMARYIIGKGKLKSEGQVKALQKLIRDYERQEKQRGTWKEDPANAPKMTNKEIKEALNKLDMWAIDNDTTFHDLKTLYEAFVNPHAPVDQKKKEKIQKALNDPTMNKDKEKLQDYIAGILARQDEALEETLEDDDEFTKFKSHNTKYNKKFDNKKFGKYFDKNGKLIADTEDEYWELINEQKSKILPVNDLGTMSPEVLAKIESRRDKLWDKEDRGIITAAEKRELAKITKKINTHYKEKKRQMGESLKEDINNVNYVEITDIDWDTDGEEVDLPTTETLPIEDLTDINDAELVEEEIADWLSDTYGWLVNNFSYEFKYDEMLNESLKEAFDPYEIGYWNYGDEEIEEGIRYCEENGIDIGSLTPLDFEDIVIKANNIVG